jgi:hypothetical protein
MPVQPNPNSSLTYRGKTTGLKPLRSGNMNSMYQGPADPMTPAAAEQSAGAPPTSAQSFLAKTTAQNAARAKQPTDNRSVYVPGQYAAGSMGDENSRVNAGIYEPGSIGAQNATANGTGLALSTNRIDRPVTGLPAPRTGLQPVSSYASTQEARNPLTGDQDEEDQDQLPGSVATINPGRALGFSRAGGNQARGQDAQPRSALYASRFAPSGNLRGAMDSTYAGLRS